MCEHDFKPLKIEKDGKRVQACQECGALKIGNDTIVIDEDYIDLASLTSDPALAEGRVWFRGDLDKTYWSPDGATREAWSTEWIYDLSSIKGFTYLMSGAPTDSWDVSVNTPDNPYVRQYSTPACWNIVYQARDAEPSWTADNTGVNVPDKAGLVYGGGEILSVSLISDGTDQLIKTYSTKNFDIHGITWDGDYYYASGHDVGFVYKFDKNLNLVYSFDVPIEPTGLSYDGQYFWISAGTPGWIYHISLPWTVKRSFDSPGGTPEGVVWNGSYLIHTGNAPGLQGNWIYELNPDGTIHNAISNPGSDLNDLEWDGQYLWSGDNNVNHVYCLDENYNPTGLGFDRTLGPWGVCWDGRYLTLTERSVGAGPWYGIYRTANAGTFDMSYDITPV